MLNEKLQRENGELRAALRASERNADALFNALKMAYQSMVPTNMLRIAFLGRLLSQLAPTPASRGRDIEQDDEVYYRALADLGLVSMTVSFDMTGPGSRDLCGHLTDAGFALLGLIVATNEDHSEAVSA